MAEFTVVFDETWPFRIRVMDGKRNVVAFDRIATDSRWKTLDDVRCARDRVTFDVTQKELRELIARQEREAHMFAASFDLYEALGELMGEAGALCREPVTDGEVAARAALKKAEGRS